MPCAMKVACTVWSRGKGIDNIKALPNVILNRGKVEKEPVGVVLCEMLP